MRFFGLLALFSALPTSAQQAGALRDFLETTRQNLPVISTSQPLFEMPVQIRTAADIPFKTPLFTFVRIRYSQRNATANSLYWAVDYPEADRAFSEQVEYLTDLRSDAEGRILELTDPTIGQYPFVYIGEAGHLQLSDDDVAALRSYLLGGGFLLVDDFWGGEDWTHVSAEFRRVLPEHEIVELPIDHAVFRSYFHFEEKPQVPGLRDVVLNAREGRPLQTPSYRGFIDADGRLMVIFCHNADFGDAWEHANGIGYPLAFSFGQAIPMGLNIVVYALSH